MTESIVDVMKMIPEIRTDSVLEKIHWIVGVNMAMKHLKREMADSYFLINTNLAPKILDPVFNSEFQSYDMSIDVIKLLTSKYSSKANISKLEEDAKDFSQGSLEILIYYNLKLRKLRSAYSNPNEEFLIEKIMARMATEDKARMGLQKIQSLDVLLGMVETLSAEKKEVMKQPDGAVNAIQEEMKALKEKIEKMQEQSNYVNYEVRGRAKSRSMRGGARGRGRGGQREPRREEKLPDLCLKCHKEKPNEGYKYCQKCFLSYQAGFKKNNRSYNNYGDYEDEYVHYNTHVTAEDDQANALLLNDGLVSNPKGILVDFSKKTKYASIQGKLGESKVEQVIMIDTGASISLVDESVGFLREEVANMSIRFGNGTTTIAKSKRLICIYVNRSAITAWAYVTKGLPTPVILGMDYLRRRAVIDLVKDNIRLYSDCINLSDMHSASIPDPILLPKKIEGTEFLYDDYPFMLNLPLGPDADGVDFRALLLYYIRKYADLEKKMVWVHNESFEFPIESDPSVIPIHNSPIVYNGEERELVESTVRNWFEKGVIRRSTSPWAHQILIAQQLKPNDEGFELGNRVCPNLIPINKVTKPMSYPLPNPREIVDRVTGRFKSVFDGSKGYLRFKVREEDKFKTAFITQNIKGLGDKFEFNFMPWGATNAGRFYQEKMENNLRPTTIGGKYYPRNLKNECAEGFQDDVIVHSDSKRQHFEDVKETLDRLFNLGIPINWKKVKICTDQITYCGYSITNEGIIQDQTRVKALSRMRPPSSFAELDIFMGMANCHREFIKDYASEMKPLLDLQNLDRRGFKFEDSFRKVHFDNFNRFMLLIQKKTLLTRPGEGEYHIFTDMSEKFKTLSAQLIRVHLGKRYLVSYASKRLSATESCYSTPKLEMMAIWYGLMKFKMIVSGRKVKVFTDHRSLQGLHLKDPRKRWATWLTDIIEINPEVIHVSGKDNPVADAMTRLSDWANAIMVQRQDTRIDIIKNYHHHFSDRKTVMNIRDKYNWEGIYSDVAKFRETCEYCQKNRGADVSNPMTPIIPERLWQILGIDIKGPITLKNDERKQYGIAVDYFSKNTFIFSLNSYTAKEFWLKFEKDVLDRISTPHTIIGDSAKQFLCAEAELYKDKYSFTFQPSSACRHQANGEVENKIKFVDQLMHSFLSRGVSWRESIRSTLKIVNHEVVNDSTLHTPYEIIHGQKHLSPFDVKVQMRIDEITKLHNEVRSNIELSKTKQQYYYDQGTKKVLFKENDWVLVYDNYRKGYQTDKRKGPFKIEKVLQNDNYLVYNHLLATWRQYNADKLKLFVPNYDVVPDAQLEEDPFGEVPKFGERPSQQLAEGELLSLPDAVLPRTEPLDRRILVEEEAQPREQKYALRSRGILPGTADDYRYRPSSYGPLKK